MFWLKNEDNVESQKSAWGMKDAFCQIQYHLEYWSKGIQNLKLAEAGETRIPVSCIIS